MDGLQNAGTEVKHEPAPSTRSKGQEIDWGKYGLSDKSHYAPKRTNGASTQNGNSHSRIERGEVKELFEEEGEVLYQIINQVTYMKTVCFCMYLIVNLRLYFCS